MNQFLKKYLLSITVLLLLMIGLMFRFYNLTLDPFPAEQFGAGWADEGPYAHNARNKYLFGEWQLANDYWNPIFVSPIHTYATFFSFSQFGQSLTTLRTQAAIVSLVSVLIAGFFAWRKNNKFGLIFLTLCITNSFLIAFARVATLEHLILSLLFLVIGFLLSEQDWGWSIAGLLTPLLLLTKITTLPYVVAFPVAIMVSVLFGKKRADFKRMTAGYFLGLIVSVGFLGLLFAISGQGWLAMNFTGYSSRISLSLFKTVGVASHYVKYFYLLGVIPALALVSFGYRLFKTSWQNWNWLEYLILTALIFFGGYTLLADYQLRRIVTITPFLLVLVSMEINELKGLQLKFGQNWLEIKSHMLVASILLIYGAWNLFPAVLHFNRGLINPEAGHRFVNTTRLLDEKVLPDDAVVYGNWASALSVGADYKALFAYPKIEYANQDHLILDDFESGKITHAIFPYDLHDQADRIYYNMDYPESPVWQYLDSNFYLKEKLPFKYHKYNNDQTFLYIYERIDL